MSLSIANRILLGFAVAFALKIVIGAIALTQIAGVRDAMETIITRNLTAMGGIAAVRAEEARAQDDREAVVTRFLQGRLGQATPLAPSGVGETNSDWPESSASAVQKLAQALSIAQTLHAQAVSPERAAAWQQLTDRLSAAGSALQALTQISQRQVDAAAAGDLAGVTAAGAALDAARRTVESRLADVDSTVGSAIGIGQSRMDTIYDQSKLWILLSLLAALLITFGIALTVRRSVSGPLATLMTFVGGVGRGELDSHVDRGGPHEIAGLADNLNAMVDGLRQIARQSRETSEELTAAAAEIRASTQQQAASVEEQLAAVQETAATVDEITHTGAQIGKRAQEVIASAQATAQTSTAGLKAVDDIARAMDLIRDQAEAVAETVVSLSEKTAAIESIIATVNDVSERSHLLALNAAIEAAGAGESGQRFAVVAAEMKTLADQAKDATAQVRSILGDIQRGINSSVMLTEEAVKRVAAGKERTDITQATIEEITGRIQESVQTFQQIVASTNQQQLGIEQVMGALQNIRQASQQTAAGTRQLDTAAGNLSNLAQAMVRLIERYRL